MDLSTNMKTVQNKIKEVESLVKLVKANGVDTTAIEKKIENSTVLLMKDDLDKASALSEEAFDEINILKTTSESQKKPKKGGMGKGLGALIRDDLSIAKNEENVLMKSTNGNDSNPGGNSEPQDKRKEELKLIIDDWKSQGYDISLIEKDLNKDMATLEESFLMFSDKVSSLEDLRDDLDEIKEKFKDVVPDNKALFDALDKKLFDPNKLDEAEEEIENLPKKLEEEAKKKKIDEVANQRKSEIQLIIDDWKSEGYQVEELEKAMDSSLEELDMKFIDISDKVQTLIDANEELDELLQKNSSAEKMLEKRILEFRAISKNIENVDDVEMKARHLTEFIEKNGPELSAIQNRLKDLESKQVDISELRSKFEGDLGKLDLKTISLEIEKMDENIGRAQEIKEFLIKLDVIVPAEIRSDPEIEPLYKKIKDLDTIVNDYKKVETAYPEFQNDQNALTELAKKKELQFKAQNELRDQKLNMIKPDLDKWAKDGFKVQPLLDAMNNNAPVDELEEKYNHYKQKMETLNFQSDVFKKLLTPENIADFGTEIEAIKEDLKDPEKADEVTETIIKFQYTVKQKEKEREAEQNNSERVEYIKKMYEAYKKEGYNVEKLMEAFDKDIDTLENTFTDIKTRIQRIEDIKSDLMKIDVRGLENVAAPIFDSLSDPYKLDETEAMVKDLKDVVAKNNLRRDEIEQVIKTWKGAGFDTTSIENAMSNDLATLEERFAEFSHKIEKLISLKEELESLNTTGFEKKVKVIQNKMDNPENLEAIVEEMDFLKREMANRSEAVSKEAEEKKFGLENTIKTWKADGYNVSSLESLLNSGDIDGLENQIAQYQPNYKKAEDLKKKISAIKEDFVQEDLALISDNIANLDIIDELIEGFTEIQKRLEEHQASSGKYAQLVTKYKEEGYITTKLEAALTGSSSDLEGVFSKFESDVKILGQLREALVDLQNRPHPMEYNEIFTELFIKVADPDRIAEIGQNIEELQKQLDELDKALEEKEAEDEAAEDDGKKVVDTVKPDEDIPKGKKVPKGKKPVAKVAKKKKVSRKPVPKGAKPVAKAKKPKAARGDEVLEKITRLKSEANEANKRQDYKKAIEVYNQILVLNPGDKESAFKIKRAKTMLKKAGTKTAAAAPAAAPKADAAQAAGGTPKSDGAGEDGPKCTSCGGEGKCYWCNGSGKCDSCNGSGKNLMGNECISCKGTGKCQNCDGAGLCYWCNGTGIAQK